MAISQNATRNSLNGDVEISACWQRVRGAQMLQDDADGLLGTESDFFFGRIDVGGDDERVDALKQSSRLSGGSVSGGNGGMARDDKNKGCESGQQAQPLPHSWVG